MIRVKNEQSAKLMASKKINTEDAIAYGMSVFDGFWYIGTRKQLKNIGAMVIYSIEKVR